MPRIDAKTRAVIEEAERLLALRTYDAAHDLAHHRSVLATAQDIAQHISEPFDSVLVKIVCLWHDVLIKDYKVRDHRAITRDTANYLKDFMLQAGFAKAQAENAFLAVKHHEFDDRPVNTEGWLLFDADKLDLLNLERVRRFVASDRMGEVPGWKLKAYIKGGVAMIKLTRHKLHFDYSRQLFDKIVDELWDDPEVAHYAEKYDVDLDDIKRALRNRTLLDKIVAFIKK